MKMTPNLPANIGNLITALETAKSATPETSSDFQYLKLSKAGEWVYGADETEVSSDSAFVIDPMSYAQGFVAWDDGELIDEAMAVAGQPPIIPRDLPTLAAGVSWDAQVAFALKGIDGKEEGIQMLYKTSSRGGKKAVAELLSKIIARGKSGDSTVCPIIFLDNDSYKHKKYGKIYTPVLTVDEWINMASEEPKEGDEEPEAEEPKAIAKPKAKKRAKAKVKVVEPEPEEEEEEEEEEEAPVAVAEEPKRARRRRSA